MQPDSGGHVKRLGLITAIILLFFAPAKAGTLVFGNGDRLQGQIERLENSTLIFVSRMLGIIQIPLEKVDTFSGDKNVVIVLRQGAVEKGKANIISEGNWEVEREGKRRLIPPDEISSIYSEEMYEKVRPDKKTRPWEDWEGSMNLGYGLVQGTRDASSLNASITGMRSVPNIPGIPTRRRTIYNLNFILSSTMQQDGLSISTQTASTNLRQEYLLSDRGFLFWTGGLDHNDALNLNLRQTYGGGFGYDWIKNERMELSLLGGMTINRENFQQQLNRTQGEFLAGERFRIILFPGVQWISEIRFFPSLNNTGQYRLNAVSSLVSRITKTISFQMGLTDNYISQPLGIGQKNQFSFTSGLAVHF